MTDREIYLQSLQGTVSRLSGHSSYVKGWSITVASGLSALAITQKSHLILFVTLVPTALFWMLDSYYLAIERRFRSLYNIAFKTHELRTDQMHFDHPTVKETGKMLGAAFSVPLVLFYFLLMILEGAAQFSF